MCFLSSFTSSHYIALQDNACLFGLPLCQDQVLKEAHESANMLGRYKKLKREKRDLEKQNNELAVSDSGLDMNVPTEVQLIVIIDTPTMGLETRKKLGTWCVTVLQ